VLPCAIDYATVIAASPRADRQVRVLAADCGQAIDQFALDAPILPRQDAPWANHVRGMLRALLEDGWPLAGADLAIAGDVPQGAGLSSSASLAVAVGQAFKTLQGLAGLAPTQIARLAQRAENQFIGVSCGIMDQLISVHGQAGHALLIDCRSLATTAVPLPAEAAVMIVHSRVRRGLVDSEYNTRRRQCEAAARHCGVAALRDLDLATLLARAQGLDPVVLRRARHIVTDSRRAVDAAQALRQGDLFTLGRLMADSHASMRDDFEITTPAIDGLVAIAQAAIGREGGARMTGGGFGGCIVAVLPKGRVAAVRQAVDRGYRSPEGEAPWIWVTEAAAGAGALSPQAGI
jgi:galactokinase